MFIPQPFCFLLVFLFFIIIIILKGWPWLDILALESHHELVHILKAVIPPTDSHTSLSTSSVNGTDLHPTLLMRTDGLDVVDG